MSEKNNAHRRNCDPHQWWNRKTSGLKILMGILFAIGVVAVLGLFGLLIMSLWNALMPDIFGLKTISYWQGWGLFMLSFIFFKGFGGSHHHAERRRKTQLRRHMQTAMENNTTDTTENPEA